MNDFEALKLRRKEVPFGAEMRFLLYSLFLLFKKSFYFVFLAENCEIDDCDVYGIQFLRRMKKKC